MRALLLVIALLARPCFAGEWHVLDLEEFSMDAAKIKDYRDSYYRYDESDEHWKNSVAANFNLSILKYNNWGLYLDNRIHGETTDSQYRRVGWQFEGGLDLGGRARIWLRHHSQHIMEAERDDHFPLENYVGASVVFYKRGK